MGTMLIEGDNLDYSDYEPLSDDPRLDGILKQSGSDLIIGMMSDPDTHPIFDYSSKFKCMKASIDFNGIEASYYFDIDEFFSTLANPEEFIGEDQHEGVLKIAAELKKVIKAIEAKVENEKRHSPEI